MYGKKEIARRLAGQLRVSAANAADQVDRAVAEVLRKLRRGEKATLPGVGILGNEEQPGKTQRRK